MRSLLFISLLLFCTLAFGHVTIQVQAPRQAQMGEKIHISYVVNTKNVDDFSLDDFEDFNVHFGPSTSSRSEHSIINGKITSSSSLTYTYVVAPRKEGECRIPAATVVVDGKSYTSKTAQVQVFPASSQNQASSSQSAGSQGASRNSSAPHTSVSAKDLYVTATVSKTKVYEQEAVLLSYKVYTLLGLRDLNSETPSLDGFHVQEINESAQRSLVYERVNGQTYGTVVWREFLLFPQRSGKLKIPSIKFDAQIEMVNQSADPFDLFFGGGSMTQIVKKTIQAPSVEVDVMSLPSPRPDNFSGAVGVYTMSSSLSPQQLNANDAATLQLVVSGYGNMKLMKAPQVNFPKDFEVYSPKVEDNTTYATSGAKGKVKYDYVVVPRHGGQYALPAVEFCYFDIEQKKYKTLQTQAYQLDVKKSTSTHAVTPVTSKEDVKLLSNDIRFIKLGKVNFSTSSTLFKGGTQYYLLYLLSSLLFLLFLFIFRRYVKANSNLVRKRNRKAGKVASKHLRQAHKMMKENNKDLFYDEMMHALLGYVGDKLNMHTAELNKENVREALEHQGIDSSLIESYLSLISQCEFAKFAPTNVNDTMEQLYKDASTLIEKLNDSL